MAASIQSFSRNEVRPRQLSPSLVRLSQNHPQDAPKILAEPQLFPRCFFPRTSTQLSCQRRGTAIVMVTSTEGDILILSNTPAAALEKTPMSSSIHQSADVSASAHVGDDAKIWHLAQIREDAQIGENVIVGRGAYVGSGVRVGSNSKIQNYALVYEPAVLGDGVFIGPAAVLTNDTFPRAINADLTAKTGADWVPVGVTVQTGASIGARAVCVAPVNIGCWSMVAAGAVVTRDTLDYSLVAGVPATRIGWVGKSGQRLIAGEEGVWNDPATGELYEESCGQLREIGEHK